MLKKICFLLFFLNFQVSFKPKQAYKSFNILKMTTEKERLKTLYQNSPSNLIHCPYEHYCKHYYNMAQDSNISNKLKSDFYFLLKHLLKEEEYDEFGFKIEFFPISLVLYFKVERETGTFKCWFTYLQAKEESFAENVIIFSKVYGFYLSQVLENLNLICDDVDFFLKNGFQEESTFIFNNEFFYTLESYFFSRKTLVIENFFKVFDTLAKPFSAKTKSKILKKSYSWPPIYLKELDRVDLFQRGAEPSPET